MGTCPTGASVKGGVDGATWLPIDASAYSLITSAPLPWWGRFFAFSMAAFEMQVSDLCALNPDDPEPPGVDVWAKALLIDRDSQKAVSDFLVAKIKYLQFQANCVCNGIGGCTNLWPSSPSGYAVDDVDAGWWYGTEFTVPTTKLLNGIKIYAPHSGANCRVRVWDETSSSYIGDDILVAPAAAGWQSYTFSAPVTLNPAHTYIAEEYFNASAWQSIRDPTNVPTSSANCTYTRHVYGRYNLNPDGVSAYAYKVSPIVCDTDAGPPTTPTAVVQPPQLVLPGANICTTYQDVCNALEDLTLRLQWLQKSTSPLAYINRLTPSTIHYPLTNQGDIVVSDILAALVTLNVVPSSYGTEEGRPSERWRVGRVSWSDAYGVIGSAWIGRTTELVVPTTTTLLGYWFAPGVTATITELVAGK